MRPGRDIFACPSGHRMKYVATIFDRKASCRLASRSRREPRCDSSQGPRNNRVRGRLSPERAQ